MKLPLLFGRALFALVLGGLLAAPLAAQNLLYTDVAGKMLLVRKAAGNRPCVLIDGKMTMGDSYRFALKKTEEYRPEFINIKSLEVRTEYLNVEGSAINNEFIFHAEVDTPYYLPDAFIVLELNTEIAGKVLFLQEIGDLEPRWPRTISVRVPLTGQLGEGHYHFHLFAGGQEVMHTKMPPLVRDRLVDKMTFKRIAGVQDAQPQLFCGPPPEYPPALEKSKTVGRAVIAVRIGTNGEVYDPKIKNATDPAFGESALTAVRLWRFLPKVKNGRPVEATVDVPIDFKPPEKKT